MFETSQFWTNLLVFFFSLIVVYALLIVFVFHKQTKLFKYRQLLLNGFLTIGVLFILYQIWALIGKQLFLQSIVLNTADICALALATTGIVLIFKTSTTTNFAQGMMATFGAYVAAKAVLALTNSFPEMSNFVVVLLAMIASALTAFALGIFIDAVIIRNARRVTSVGKQMITMGLVLVFSGIMPLIFGILSLEIPRFSYDPAIPFHLFGASLTISVHAWYSLLVTILLLALLFSALRFTKWGLGVRATASNEVVASMMGVNTRVITAMSWAIAGLLGGVAAVIYAPGYGSVSVTLMVSNQVNGFMAAILGSFSSFGGPLLSSVLMKVLTALLVFIVPLWQNAVVYLFILLVVLIKPLGLFGKRIAKKV